MGQKPTDEFTILKRNRILGRYGVNPYDYLKDVLIRLPAAKSHEGIKFTPSAWAKARREASRAHAA